MTVRIINLSGSHYEMGRQHAQQVQDLRAWIAKAVERRLRSLRRFGVDWQPYAAELATSWEQVTRPTMDMLRGMAEGLNVRWESFLRYTIAGYLRDRIQATAHSSGCTVWAASGPLTVHNVPMLVKNRDHRPDHPLLPCLARAQPRHGYRYIYVTSAGSPAVFSSGINEAGLAVADTRVSSRDVGPGVARYSAMMELLEHHGSVATALDYLRQIPHVGDGKLTLVDSNGIMAVFEAGHTAYGIVQAAGGFVVSTNHYVTQPLCDRWLDPNPRKIRGNTQNRYTRVTTALQAAHGRVDVAWAHDLMADHGGPQPTDAQRRRHSICRHSDIDRQFATISLAVYLPQERLLLYGDGSPCLATLQSWSVA